MSTLLSDYEYIARFKWVTQIVVFPAKTKAHIDPVKIDFMTLSLIVESQSLTWYSPRTRSLLY